ncbi:DUF4339 domain-containing protein, partial [bacterium]|nr:DUF4339 domain-containing protein [bacterium]
MSGGFPQEWFLELNGKRTGPFSPEQLLGLLADGEIPEDVTVHPGADSEAPGLTVAEMRDAYFHDDRIPDAASPTKQHSGKAFHDGPDWDSSPSIPVARVEPQHHEAATNLATSRRLFELFQTARDRRAKFSPPSEAHLSSQSTHGGWSLLKAPVLTSLAASLVVVALGVRWSGSGSKEEAQRQLAQSSTAIQPAQPVQPRMEPKQELHRPAKLQNTWRPS